MYYFDDSISAYMKDISIYGLITSEEEKELGKRISEGDTDAREKLIVSNLRLVIKIATDYTAHGVILSDIIPYGNLGLIKAVDRFDYKNGA